MKNKTSLGVLRASFALIAGLAVAGTAQADRPFIATTSAAAEEDDDRLWSVATVFDARRGVREFGLAAEYAFDPARSIEFTLGHGRLRDRGETARTSGVEVEYKQLFARIARDGWGWGVALALGAAREDGERWRGGAWAMTLPLSVAFAQGEVLLHANAGLEREPGERREALRSVGIEAQAWRRVTLFAEAARAGDAKLLHAGARWWLQPERLAIDLGATHRRDEGAARRGAVLALAWYDL